MGKDYFINSDALALVVNANRHTLPSGGPVITTALVYDGERVKDADGQPDARRTRCHRASLPGGGRSWFLIQDGGYPLAIERLTAVFKSPLLLGRNRFDTEPFVLTTIGAAAAQASDLDRYESFLDGLHAAFTEGEFPDIVPEHFKTAFEALHRLAQGLRDHEIGDLAEDVRDAVLMKFLPFRLLKRFHVDTACPRTWRWFFRLSLWIMHIDRPELL